MIRRTYEALLLDLDGTLLGDDEEIRPRVLERVRATADRGVRVMIATGRSEGGARSPLARLALGAPAIVYNGGGLFCPRTDRLVEEHLLSDRTVARTLAFAADRGFYTVVQRSGEKFAAPPRDADEEAAVRWLEDMHIVPDGVLPREYVMRITVFSGAHDDSGVLARELEAALDMPAYLTDFPLAALPYHRGSGLQVVDVQPPCRGKAEGLRYLHDVHGIAPDRVVAVGDATNDLPMVSAAGYGVAMGNSMAPLLAVADRVIGDNNTDAIADLLDELFG